MTNTLIELKKTNSDDEEIGGIKTFTDPTDAISSTQAGTRIEGGLAVQKSGFFGKHLGIVAVAWNAARFFLGNYNFWINNNYLYCKNGTPGSATDGFIVGRNLPVFSARRTTNQALTHNTAVKLVYASEDKDSHNCHDTTTGIYTIASGEDGDYRASATCNVTFTSGTANTATLELLIYLNGVAYASLGRVISPASTGITVGCGNSIILPNLVAGNQIAIYALAIYVSATPTINFIGTAKCAFSIDRVA